MRSLWKPVKTFVFVFGALLTGCAEPPATTTSPINDRIAATADAVCPILIGQKVPPLVLKNVKGEAFDLNNALSQKPTVLIFYRGGWCPYCNLHLAELRNIEEDLQKLGFQIIAVSPDRPALLKPAIEKNELGYTLLSDSDMQAARAFGIAFSVADETVSRYKEKHGIDLEADSGRSHHLLPVPSAFVIDREGMITFSYVNPNYKVRIDAPLLLEAARSLKRTKGTDSP